MFSRTSDAATVLYGIDYESVNQMSYLGFPDFTFFDRFRCNGCVYTSGGSCATGHQRCDRKLLHDLIRTRSTMV